MASSFPFSSLKTRCRGNFSHFPFPRGPSGLQGELPDPQLQEGTKAGLCDLSGRMVRTALSALRSLYGDGASGCGLVMMSWPSVEMLFQGLKFQNSYSTGTNSLTLAQ